jgi:hypothetical protein
MTLFEVGIEKESLLNLMAVERIAKAYTEAPNEILSIPEDDCRIIHRLVTEQFTYLSKKRYFEFVPTEPYKYDVVSEMGADFFNRNKVVVNTTGNNSDFWGELYNLMFRGVHDYYHIHHGLDFNYLDEVEAYKNQFIHSHWIASQAGFARDVNWSLYARLLRSEIVYQAAYKTYYKEFHLPEQKIILSDL